MAQQDKTAKEKKPKKNRGLDEVAVKLNQAPENAGEYPEYEFFTDDAKNIRTEKCATCEDVFAIGYSRIYRTKRKFEDLCDQLQRRLEEDHRAGRNHAALIPLRWFEPTRKRKREQKS